MNRQTDNTKVIFMCQPTLDTVTKNFITTFEASE